MLAIKYRIPMLYSTDLKKLSSKRGISKDASISLKSENKIVRRGRWGEGNRVGERTVK